MRSHHLHLQYSSPTSSIQFLRNKICFFLLIKECSLQCHQRVFSLYLSHSFRLPREVNCIIKALGLLINRHFIRNARKCLAIEFQMKMSTLVSISDWDSVFADCQLQMRLEKLCVRRERTIGVGK